MMAKVANMSGCLSSNIRLGYYSLANQEGYSHSDALRWVCSQPCRKILDEAMAWRVLWGKFPLVRVGVYNIYKLQCPQTLLSLAAREDQEGLVPLGPTLSLNTFFFNWETTLAVKTFKLVSSSLMIQINKLAWLSLMSRYAECRYAECRYAECHFSQCSYAECRYAECHYAECHYAECRYAECRYAECHNAECHYAECRYADCHGAAAVSYKQ